MRTRITTDTPKPTVQQRAVLGFLFAFHADEDRLPTRAEISSHFGWSSTNAADTHVRALIESGLIEKRGPNLRFARTERGREALADLKAREQGDLQIGTPEIEEIRL